MLKKLFSHSFLYAVGPQIPRFANLLVLPIITQYLTPLDYGVYGTLLAYTGLMQGLKSLGFDVLLVNTFFKKKQWKAYWSRYIGGLYVYNVFFAIVYTLLLYFLMPHEAQKNVWLLISLIVIPALLFDVTKMAGSRFFQLNQKPRYIALVSAIVGSITIFINLYTIAYLKMGYLGWFIALAVGSLLSFCFYAVPVYFKEKLIPVLTTNVNFWKKSLKVSLPTIPHNYSSYLLNSSDRLVMDQLKTPIEQIGIYNMAYVFGGYLEMFGTAVGMAVGPYYTKLHAQKNEVADKAVRALTFFLQFSFVLLCVLIALWVKEVFKLLIKNDELQQAYSIAIIIIMGYAYRPLYWAAGSKIMYFEHTNKLWRISFVAGALNVVLNLIFIPMYGIFAAAVTTLISLMYMGISPYYIKEFKAMNTQQFYPVLWMSLVMVLTIVLYFIRDIAIGYKAVITIILLVAYLIYFFKNKNKLNAIQI